MKVSYNYMEKNNNLEEVILVTQYHYQHGLDGYILTFDNEEKISNLDTNSIKKYGISQSDMICNNTLYSQVFLNKYFNFEKIKDLEICFDNDCCLSFTFPLTKIKIQNIKLTLILPYIKSMFPTRWLEIIKEVYKKDSEFKFLADMFLNMTTEEKLIFEVS